MLSNSSQDIQNWRNYSPHLMQMVCMNMNPKNRQALIFTILSPLKRKDQGQAYTQSQWLLIMKFLSSVHTILIQEGLLSIQRLL